LHHWFNNLCFCTSFTLEPKNRQNIGNAVAKLWFKRHGALEAPLIGFCNMKIGYARVSTDAQETHLQMDALKRAKCGRVYEEKASGAKADRPEREASRQCPQR
jgi:hypothetical protein